MKNRHIIYLLISIIASIALINPISVKAEPSQEGQSLGYCFYCNVGSEFYEKETQFIKKVKIIKKVFGDKIDEIVLAATVLHQYTLNKVIEDQYDDNFDASEFESSWSLFNSNVGSLENVKGKTNPEDEQIDLLTAATIIMLDSNGFGPYNEEKYKEALAKSQLVGDNTIFGQAFNNAFCTAGAVIDIIGTPFEYIHGVFTGQDIGQITNRKQTRWINMDKICKNGYIGGVYDDVYITKDEKTKQAKKDLIAQNIIEFSEEYKRLYRKNTNNSCLTGSTLTGDLQNMDAKMCGEKFGPLAQAEYSRSGVFASVTLAQAWIESNCGKATPPESNNLFGIKCSSNWQGECSSAITSEYGVGGSYTIKAGFRKYNSVEESIADHSKFLTDNSRYTQFGVFNATNYADQIKAIHNAGYATDPDYATKIINTIKANNFDKWDVKTNTTSSSSICSPVGTAEWSLRTITPTLSDTAFNYVNSNRGQCVWYAQGRSIEIVQALEKSGKLSKDQANNLIGKLLGAYGNGGDIYDNTRNIFKGSSNIQEPKAGSYIVWKKAGGYGHVAVVEDINKIDKTITISEGWSTIGNSCPNDWNCVGFKQKTYDLDQFYQGYGKSYTGDYTFSGYVYFLEPVA